MNNPRQIDLDEFVGKRLRGIRRRNGLTQTQVAKKLGVTFQTIQKYEAGQIQLRIVNLYTLAAVFGVEMAYFTDGYRDYVTTPNSNNLQGHQSL